MTARTQPALLDQIASQLPDNTSRLITPAHVRSVLTDLADSLGNQLFDVRRYGAVGDGGTDDTAAIQAAIDAALVAGGVVLMPPGNYKVTSTITLGDGAGGISHDVSLVGAGPISTKLHWQGATDGICLRIDRGSYYRVSGLHILNGVARGTTHGVWVRAGSGSGTRSTAALWESVLIDGFSTGFRAGEIAVTRSASEYLFLQCTVQFCDTGILLEDFNTLDFCFVMLGLSQCGTGMQVATAGNVHVYGGSGGLNTGQDFLLEGPSALSVNDFRSEQSRQFVQATPGGPATLTLKGCMVQALTGSYAVQLTSSLAATIMNCTFSGPIGLNEAAFASLSLFNCAIADTEPFRQGDGAGDLTSLRYTVLGCRQIDASNVYIGHFADEVGIGSGSTRAPRWRITTAGQLQFPNLPTTNPAAAGAVWSDAGVLKVSAG